VKTVMVSVDDEKVEEIDLDVVRAQVVSRVRHPWDRAEAAIQAAIEFSAIRPVNMTLKPWAITPLKGALVQPSELHRYPVELYDRHRETICNGNETFEAYFVTSKIGPDWRRPMTTSITTPAIENEQPEDPAIPRDGRREHHDRKRRRLFAEPTVSDTSVEDPRPQTQTLDPRWTASEELLPADGRHYMIPS
jgi:hypothetical protein